MRILERLLLAACWLGCLLAGPWHRPEWLLVMPAAFATLVLAEDRLVRRRIGARAWPSPAYARFVFGANVARLLRNVLIGAALFAAATEAMSLFG